MGLLSLGAGIAIGYVIGTKTGRDSFNDGLNNAIRSAEDTWNRPEVQDFVAKTTETTTHLRHDLAEGAKKAAAAASEAVKKAETLVEEVAEEFKPPETKTTYNGDVISDPGQSTERKGTDWANEGGFKP